MSWTDNSFNPLTVMLGSCSLFGPNTKIVSDSEADNEEFLVTLSDSSNVAIDKLESERRTD